MAGCALALGGWTQVTAPLPDATTATVRDLPPLGPPPVAPPATAAPALPASSPPGLRRCIGPNGEAVFTDRRCELNDATADGLPAGEPRPVAPATAPTQVVRVRTCARQQGDLLEGVRSALEARDTNRFAEFYHWHEMGNAEGYQLMARLAQFTARPLVDVQLVSSQERAAQASPYGAPPPDAPAARPRAFDLLRVDQLRGDDAIETQVTWFHLRSNAGCWWVQF